MPDLGSQITTMAAILLQANDCYAGKKEISASELFKLANRVYPDQMAHIQRGSFEGYLLIAADKAEQGIVYTGPKGGFSVRDGTSMADPPRPPDITAPEPSNELPLDADFIEEWEFEAFHALMQLLEKNEIKRALGDQFSEIDNIIRSHKRRVLGVNSPSSKKELIAAMIKIYGKDLLFSDSFAKPLRKIIAKKSGQKNPQRFVSGRASARNFVSQAGLPTQLAGSPRSTRKDDFEEVSPPEGPRNLQPYQEDCKLKLVRFLKSPFSDGGTSSLLSLPTGAGKTLVAVNAIFDWVKWAFVNKESPSEANFIIWIAQREELCEQAFSEFKGEWMSRSGCPPIRLVRFWGGYSKRGTESRSETLSFINENDQPVVLFTTYQRLLNEIQTNLYAEDPGLEIMSKCLDLIVIDEAHHSAAPSYRAIMESLRSRGAKFHLMGLTATPFRTSGDPRSSVEELEQIFRKNLVMPGPSQNADQFLSFKKYLQDTGVLAIDHHENLETGISIKLHKSDSNDQTFEQEVGEQLSKGHKKRERQELIAKKISDILSDQPNASILYFGPSVDDAFSLNVLMLIQNINSGFISSGTTIPQRRKLIEEFKAGKLRVLCNYEVLTTGFDAPCVTHVVVGRPTKSSVLYTQMIGRGLRGEKFNGTKECTIVNVMDRFDENVMLGVEEYIKEWRRSKLAPQTEFIFSIPGQGSK